MLYEVITFDDAEIWAQKASSSLSNNSSEYEECIKLLSYIKNAKYLVQSPVNVDFINLGDGINTRITSYNVCYTKLLRPQKYEN